MFELTFPEYIVSGDRFMDGGKMFTAETPAEWNENEHAWNVKGNDNKWHSLPWDTAIQVESNETETVYA